MKTNLQIFIQGQEINIPIELDADQMNEIALALNSNNHITGWEQPEDGAPCYYIDALCRVQRVISNEHSKNQIDLLYSEANCYLSENVASAIARAERLIRKLRRESIQRRKHQNDLSNEGGYTISYNYINNCLELGVTGNWLSVGEIVFDSEESAREVMNIYAEELTWYFTQRKETI